MNKKIKTLILLTFITLPLISEPLSVTAASEPEVIESPLGEFNPENPSQTIPLEEGNIPADVIKITVTPSGFEPSEFTVKAGEVVSITVTGVDATHVFKFESPELSNVAIGVANGETRGISFIAPEEPGDYVFYCDVPGHRARGEQGVMHVVERGGNITKPKHTSKPKDSNKTIKIIVPKLRVRSAPNLNAEIIDFVYQGEIYKVIEEQGSWYKINTKHNEIGWVYNKYTRETTPGETENKDIPSTITNPPSNNQTKAEKQELAERVQILETLLARLIALIQKFISSN